jgi:hypothetical protein
MTLERSDDTNLIEPPQTNAVHRPGEGSIDEL